MNSMVMIIFFIILVVILIEWKLNCPFGTMVVLCLIPPFIKRVRLYGKKWIGFDSEWKFMFLKETEEV